MHSKKHPRLIQTLLFTGLLCLPCMAQLPAETQTLPDQLKGTQTENIVTLPSRKTPYKVTANYIVPTGMMLVIEAGATLVFEPQASLLILGDLEVKGTEEEPVYFKPAQEARLWQGLQINGSRASKLNYLMITGAKTGMNLNTAIVTVSNSCLQKNDIGLILGEWSSVNMKNSVIANNKKQGALIGTACTWVAKQCSIVNNGGWGIEGTDQPRVIIAESRIQNNKGGGLRGGAGQFCVRWSSISKNGDCDIENTKAAFWPLSENYWGPLLTPKMKKNALPGKIKQIKGNVLLDNPLDAEPQRCGSLLQSDGRKLSPLTSKPKTQEIPDMIYLCELQEQNASVGYFELGKEYIGLVNGQHIFFGLFACAPSKIEFEIGDKNMNTLEGKVGFREPVEPKASCKFIIYGDDKIVWQSGTIKPNPASLKTSLLENFKVPVTGVQALRLVVDDLGDKTSDHSCWINPVLKRDK